MVFTREKVGVEKIIIICFILAWLLHGTYQEKGRSSKDYYNKFPLSMITPLHLPGKKSE